MTLPSATGEVHARSRWAALGITCLAVFAVLLDALVLFVAFPAIQRTFSGVSSGDLSWVLNGYTIVYGALLVPAGRFADLIGRRRVFLAGIALFTAASVACGVSGALPLLISFRVIQAIGGALLTPSSLALTLAAFPREKRPIAVTLWAAVGALAVLLGPPLGSVVVQAFGWPAIFFLNLPIGVAAFLLGRRILSESRDAQGGALPDMLGLGLLIAGATSVAFGVVESEAWGWADRRVLVSALAGVILLAAFVRRCAVSPVPVLDLRLFSNRNFALANLGQFIFSVAFSALFLGAVYFLTRVWGYSLVRTGLAMMPGPLMVALIAPLAGQVVSRRGHRFLLVPGGLLYAAGAMLLALFATSEPHFGSLYLPAGLVTGLGVALVLPVLGSAAVHDLPASELALGSGVATAIRQFGSVLGVAITIAMLGRTPGAVGTFVPVWILMATCGVLVSVSSLGIDTRSDHPEFARHTGASALD